MWKNKLMQQAENKFSRHQSRCKCKYFQSRCVWTTYFARTPKRINILLKEIQTFPEGNSSPDPLACGLKMWSLGIFLKQINQRLLHYNSHIAGFVYNMEFMLIEHVSFKMRAFIFLFYVCSIMTYREYTWSNVSSVYKENYQNLLMKLPECEIGNKYAGGVERFVQCSIHKIGFIFRIAFQ